jgi:ectoine hydroxylase-related dioxygenase (phytanoyl-CoA dioxygenase family)
MLEHDLEALNRDGYLIRRDVLGESERRALVDALAPFERAKPMGRNEFEGERSQRVYSLVAKGAPFVSLIEHPYALELLDGCLDEHFLLSTSQSIRLHPGETPQPWHTDDSFYPVPRPLTKRLALSFIWALEDFSEENGATELLPGSHRWNIKYPEANAGPTVRAVMPAGSVLVFEGALWHRGGENTSRGTRLCVSTQYCQPWLRPQESQLLIASRELVRDASPRVRSMLGYNIHPPFIGQVDGMHPLRLVDPDYRAHKTQAAEIADRVLARPELHD